MTEYINRLVKTTLCLASLLVILSGPVMAQGAENPVMKNVFYNTLWGSGWGALMGLSMVVIEAEDKSQPGNISEPMFQGVTIGGVLGFGVGLFLVLQGISFDQSAAPLSKFITHNDTLNGTYPGQPPGTRPTAYTAAASSPFEFITDPQKPYRITGMLARVAHFRF
ncbi:MAG: hypothetical protein OEZ59_10285 [Deltaproteobacteria bacterium]|nr:hypothetical protein [Deltaproteobacteria bacterium]